MNRKFTLTETALKGLWIAERNVFTDSRGIFGKLFCAKEFRKAGVTGSIEEINYSFNTRKGTVRGLHFQYPPHSETRIVTCLKGEIFDVAVDLRRNSATFLQWHGENLSESNHRSMIIPAGFAHGFQTLTDNCELVYMHTGTYVPESEGGINARDSKLAIDWPLPVRNLSDRDINLPFVDDYYEGITL